MTGPPATVATAIGTSRTELARRRRRRQYQDSSKLMARALLHMKYAPAPWSLAETGLITAGARILDIGCGNGRFWAANARLLPGELDLTLADQSPGMVDEAVRNVANGKWRAVTGKVADVCALPFADDSFDIVTAMHMLYHAEDKDRAVAEIARVLKPGGKLVATTNGAETMRELNQLSQAVFGEAPNGFGSLSFSLESGEPLLRRHFDSVEVHAKTDVLRVTDAQDVVNYLRSFPPGDDADDATLRILEVQLSRRMAAEDGVFPITRIAGYMVASGRKTAG